MIVLADSEVPDQTAWMCRVIWSLLSTYPWRQVFTWRGQSAFLSHFFIVLDKSWYQLNVFILFLHKNICCGYSLEAPRREMRKISILFGWKKVLLGAMKYSFSSFQFMNHLVNYLCHFPMGIGATRLSTAVAENSDQLEYGLEDLRSDIFAAPNVQVSSLCVLYLVSWHSGPSCSKLTISLVNDSLKFTSSDTQIFWNFLLKKCE